MTKLFTRDNDLVRFIYNETSELENRQMEKNMMLDNELLDLYHEFLGVKHILNNFKNPRNESIDNILEYSKTKFQSVGQIG